MRLPLLALFVCLMLPGVSQDITNQTQFFFNPYTLNPSYAGTEGRPALFLSYRKQWSGIDGAPTISNFSFHNTSKNKLNYGVNFNSDKRGIVSTSSALVTIGYTIALDEFTWLRFGLSAGMGFNGVDVAKLGTFTDKILPSILNRNSFLMGNAGISVHHKTFHGGISLPNLFQPVYVSPDPFSVTALRPFQSVIIHASNRFYFDKDKNVFEPYVMYRLNGSGLPSQLEVAALVHLQHAVWVGGSYRQNFGISALGGIKIKNQFALGFSYSVKNTGINELNSPSYEIQLGYLTGAKKKNQFAYSFVSTEKEKVKTKTPKEIAEAKRKAEIARKQAEEKKQQEIALAKKAEEEKKLAEEQKLLEEKKLQEEKRLEEERIAKFKLDSAQREAVKTERHEIVVRGAHKEELDLGDFVIAGSFAKRENAARYTADLNKLNFTADFGFLTPHGKWYVYLYQGTDINAARAERDKFRKLPVFRDTWLLTITPK